jgi:peptidoglycan/xylan/chitin deacetylase (PgdA/CDA1 family)
MLRTRTVFLMYHELRLPGRAPCRSDPGYTSYVIDAEGFRAQLAWLRSAGLAGLSVGEALAGAGGERPGVVLTFDDGCETDLSAAAPLLAEAGCKATFYVVAGFVGRPGYLAPAQVRELADLGFEVGCHSLTHQYLTDVDARRLRLEVVGARDRLEQLLGKQVEHFSCPGGRWSRRLARLAQNAGYVSVATSRIAANGPGSDRFRLARVAVQRGMTLAAFAKACRGRGLWLRGARYRLLAAAKGLLGNATYERIRAHLLGTSG